jgi:hypothetical protein
VSTEPGQREPTAADVLTALAAMEGRLTVRLDALDTRVAGLEDRLVQRTELLRADIAGVKAEAAVEQAYGKDTAEALRRHIQNQTAHGGRAA